MKVRKAGPLLFLLSLSLLAGGCAPQVPTTYFKDSSGIYFEFPEGWSRLSKKEWQEREMGEDRTLVTIMDSERLAGFSLIRVILDAHARFALSMMDDAGEDRVSLYVDSIDAAGPARYEEYKLFGKGRTVFAGVPAAETLFQGRNPGKTLKWYRVVVLALPEDEDSIFMLVFTAPIGRRYPFMKDFGFIEDTWQW